MLPADRELDRIDVFSEVYCLMYHARRSPYKKLELLNIKICRDYHLCSSPSHFCVQFIIRVSCSPNVPYLTSVLICPAIHVDSFSSISKCYLDFFCKSR
jgi:hypothetical protein